MATTEISSDIQNITGVETANTGFIETAQRFVASKIPKELLWFAAKQSTAVTDANGFDVSGADTVLSVERNGYPAEQVPFSLSKWVDDSTSLHKATELFPKYYLAQGRVFIKPDPSSGGSDNGYVYYVDYTQVDDDSDLRSAVIFHACSQEFEKLASSKVDTWSALTAPTPPSSPSFGSDLSISATAPSSPSINTISYIDATNEDASSSDVSAITVQTVSKADISGNVPTYIKPVLTSLTSFNDYWTLGDFGDNDPGSLSVLSVQPSVPTISSASVTISGTAPTYTSPVVSLSDAPTISDLTISISPPVSPTLTNTTISEGSITEPSFIPPVMSPPDFNDTDNLISEEEDSEMLSSRVQEIQAKIADYNSKLGEARASFDKDNAIFQKDIQIAIQNAQLESQDDAQKLQKFGAEVQKYQSEVNKEIEEYQKNLDGDLQVWQAERATDLQKYGSDIQNALNNFNKENAEYQAKLQKDIQDAQLTDSNETRKLQKYSNEIQQYQSDVNKEISEYQQNLSRYQLELGTVLQAWQKSETDKISSYQSDIQNELNKFNKENAKYQASVQSEFDKNNADLQANIEQARLDAADAQQEAAQSTEISKFNKSQDQALALENSAKQMESAIQDNNITISKFSQDLNLYTHNINKEVQDFQQSLSKKYQEYQSELALYNANIQKYNAEIAEEAQNTGLNTQNAVHYSNESKKYYDWAVSEITMYIQNNSKIINRTIAAQSAQ